MKGNIVTDKRVWTADQLKGFVQKIADHHDAGRLPFAIHLPGGNEEQLIAIFSQIKPGDYVFSTHRNWYHALLHGLPENEVEEKILAGRSMFMFDRARNFFVSAIIGGTPAIAAGVALGLKLKGSTARVWCFVGDGIEDTGHFAEAVRYVDGFNLPCSFVIEDDNMAVEAPKEIRWGKREDLIWPSCVTRYKYQKTWPHIRTGNFGDIGVMKSVMKSPEEYFPSIARGTFEIGKREFDGTFKEAVTSSMTDLGNLGAYFIGYSLIPGDAMGTLKEVNDKQKIETPIAENLMVGLAIGMSFEGVLPVVYFERHDFMLVAMDAIVNHLDKIERISHGEYKPKVILKTVIDDGGLFYSGPTHSQDFTAGFREFLEMEVLEPHSPTEAIQMYEYAKNSPGPVMIVEHKKYH
jgi:hypothetical protein